MITSADDKKKYAKELSEAKKIYDKIIAGIQLPGVDPELFIQDEEKILFEAIKKFRIAVEISLKNHHYKAALLCLTKLSESANKFFDNVEMKVDDIPLRNNRFALKNELLKTFHLVANFSEIQGT